MRLAISRTPSLQPCVTTPWRTKSISKIDITSVRPLDNVPGEVVCEVDGQEIPAMRFSLGLISRIFPPRAKVLLDSDGGFNLPEGEIKGYSTKRARHGNGTSFGFIKLARGESDIRPRDEINLKIYNEKGSHNGDTTKHIKPRAQLFEIHVIGDLYTYILVAFEGIYIRTPLRKRIDVS